MNNITLFSGNAIENVVVNKDGDSIAYGFPVQVDNEKSYHDIGRQNLGMRNVLDFLNPFLNDSHLVKDTGIMPPGVLGFNSNIIIYERPPEHRSIEVIYQRVDGMSRRDATYRYILPIPWQLYVITYSSAPSYDDPSGIDFYACDVKMFFSNSRIYSFDQEVYLAPLPNLYTDGSLCRPMLSSMDDIERYSKDISGVIMAAYDWVWNSGTNIDLTESVCQMYSQFSRDELKDTVTRGKSPLFGRMSFNTYFCGTREVETLLTSWEKIPLEEICTMKWPSNSKNHRIFDDVRFADTIIHNYCAENGIASEPSFHFDEDNEEEYSCDDEDCECNVSFSEEDKIKILKEANVFPPKPLTVKTIIDITNQPFQAMTNSIIRESSDDQIFSMKIISNMVNNAFLSA